MKRVAKSLILVVLLSSFTVSPSYGLDNSDPYFSECYRIGDLAKRAEYGQFTVNFAMFVASKSLKSRKQKLEHQKLKVEEKRLRESFVIYNSDVRCESLRVDQWLSIREDRLDALKTAEEYIVKMMQKYPFTTIQCFKNGIPKDVNGINPVCPKGFKKI
jgi:hypothetical protein